MHASPGAADGTAVGAVTQRDRSHRRRRGRPPMAIVRAGAGACERPGPGSLRALMTLAWPFVGRDRELQAVHPLVTGAEVAGGSGVVLTGPMGVGKTRLAVEALQLAEQAGLATARVAGTRAAAGMPLGALAPLIAASDTPLGLTDDRGWLLRRSTETLAALAEGRRLVLLVDDAHLLDDASAALVHQIAATGAAFVVVTVPTDQPASDLVVALWKDGLADRLELEGLDDDTVTELLTRALGGPVATGTVATFAAHARGNVLFLRELVTGALQDGTLRDEDGLWRLAGDLAPSNRLIELVEARLREVTPAERALLELVSVGEPLGYAELTTLTDPAVAESLERRGFLAVGTTGRRLEARLAHPVYGDVVRARVSALRERAVARALAEAVEAAGARRREDALRVASWRLVGGGGTAETLLAGATAARWHHDYPLAERLARAAHDLGAGFDAAFLAAQTAGLQGRRDEAERELAALAAEATDDAQRALVAVARADTSLIWSGAGDTAVLDEAEATIADAGWRDQLAARRISLLLHAEGPQAAAEAAEPLLGRAGGEAFVFACISGGYSLCRTGRLDEAMDVAARGHAVQLASPTTLAWSTWWHAATRYHALAWSGRYAEAEALATDQYWRALTEGSTDAQAVFALLPAFAVAERGRVQTAARLAREAADLNRELGRPVLVATCQVYRALALAFAGRAREAEEALSALDDDGSGGSRGSGGSGGPGMHHQADLLRARGWTAAAAGRLPEARRHLEEAAAVAERIGDRIGRCCALHGLARLGHAAAVREDLAAVAAHIDGELAPARVAHVEALADQDADGLEAASRRFEDLGADLLAAEASADAAVVRRRAGEARAATAAQRRAAALAERAEGPVTPALQAVEARAQLTAAERETAMLAIAGLSSREIAGELYLSVRTVENRLQRVYEKLGISGRGQLVEALDPE